MNRLNKSSPAGKNDSSMKTCLVFAISVSFFLNSLNSQASAATALTKTFARTSKGVVQTTQVAKTMQPIKAVKLPSALSRKILPTNARQGSQPLARKFNFQSYGGQWPKNHGVIKERLKILSPGAKLSRYGSEKGYYFSPKGTSFPKRALPTGTERLTLHNYQVLKPLPSWQGTIKPAFGKPGLGVQNRMNNSAEDLVKRGYLRKI